jgi:type VI secretion system protein ImpG
MTSRRAVGRCTWQGYHGVCQGTEVTVQFDEEHYEGGELFLFSSLLDRFFGLCAPLNTFSQVVVTTTQRIERGQEALHIWPRRAGEQILR